MKPPAARKWSILQSCVLVLVLYVAWTLAQWSLQMGAANSSVDSSRTSPGAPTAPDVLRSRASWASWVPTSVSSTLRASSLRLTHTAAASKVLPGHFQSRLEWMAKPAARLFRSFAPAANFTSWEAICAVGPAATPAIWQSSQPLVLSLAYPGWLGVYTAALGLGPVMGTYIDFNKAHRRSLLSLILDTPSLRFLVIHGMPPGVLELSELLHAELPSVKVFFVYHGAMSAPFHAAGEASLLAGILDLTQEGVVYSVGTVKHGFHETLLALGSARALSVPNFPVVLPHLILQKYSDADGLLHIGVLASSGESHKNLIAQLVAACIRPNAVVHVSVLPNLDYLDSCEAQIVETGLLPHDKFIAEVTKMDVLMYVSLVECYPMLVLESAAAGIPILVSRTHHIFDSDPALEKALVVHEADNPSEISQRLAELALLSAREALRPNLLALAGCMQRKAELAWSRFLELNYKERMQLDFLRDLDASALQRATDISVCSVIGSGASDKGEIATAALAAKPGIASAGAFRVAFVTYELPPFLPGDAGEVIVTLIEELLVAGQGVTVLVHAPVDVVSQWAALMRERGWESGDAAPGGGPRALVIHHVPTLVNEERLLGHTCAPHHYFLQRAGVFAEAVGLAYARLPFDVVEFLDYAGGAYDIVRRLRRWQESPATARAPILPLHVPIVVRLHGSMQLTHQSEGVASALSSTITPSVCSPLDDSNSMPLMYLMERYALAGAHAVFAQSQGMVDLYSAAYGMESESLELAPPPMARVLAPFAGSVWGGGPKLGSHPRSSSRKTATTFAGAFRLLVYGHIGHMKGSETVAAAIGAISNGLPANTPLQLVFVGLDLACPVHGRPTSECVEHILTDTTRTKDAIKVSFEEAIDRAELPSLVRDFHGGIIASEFETFNLAAHELAACGLPLIVSDIPALREFFTPENAYPFAAGSATSLASAALSLYKDSSAGAPRVARLRYGDPLLPYQRLVALARASPAVLARHDSGKLIVADFAIGLQSRDCYASRECKKQWLGEVEFVSAEEDGERKVGTESETVKT